MEEALRQRHAMIPYLYTMNYRSYQESLPLVLPMYYEHPEERKAYEMKNQFWYGTEMIVAPITQPRVQGLNVAKVKVWLPEGIWYDIFTGVMYRGGRVLDMFRSLESIPVLAKAGGIVPFTDEIIDIGLLSYPVTLLWLVGICNAVNLIDGLDGLASGVSAIAALSIGVVAYASGIGIVAVLCLILVGSILGFLRWNFHPATLLLGDCGSLTLGFLLAVFSLMGISEGVTLIGLAVPVLILGIPVLDTLFAIIRRKRSHKPVFQADKGHFHHLLLGMGLSHRDTVLFIYAVTFLFGSMAVLITMLPTMFSLFTSFVAVVLIFAGAMKLGILDRDDGAESKSGQ